MDNGLKRHFFAFLARYHGFTVIKMTRYDEINPPRLQREQYYTIQK